MDNEPTAPTTKIVQADLASFVQHAQEILNVERELIENSSSAYLMDEKDEMDFMMDALQKGGLSYLIMEEGRVIGFLVAGPLNDGTDLPAAITSAFPVDHCMHIKMMYVGKPGQGLGSDLIRRLEADIDHEQWQYLFVRTWVNPPNKGAINFYTKRAGFTPVQGAVVSSTKRKIDDSGDFQIDRQYFAKKI